MTVPATGAESRLSDEALKGHQSATTTTRRAWVGDEGEKQALTMSFRSPAGGVAGRRPAVVQWPVTVQLRIPRLLLPSPANEQSPRPGLRHRPPVHTRASTFICVLLTACSWLLIPQSDGTVSAGARVEFSQLFFDAGRGGRNADCLSCATP